MRWNGLRGLTDVLRTSNKAETDGMSNGERAGTYLGVRDAKRVVNATDGVEGQTDASTGLTDVPSVYTDAIITANAPDIVSTPRKRQKPPDLPGGATRWTPDASDGLGDHADTSNIRTDVQSVETDALTPANAPENVRSEPKMLNSPSGTTRWTPDAPNGCGSHVEGSSVRRDAQSVETDAITARNEAERVRTSRNAPKMQDSPVEAAKQRSDERDHTDGLSVRTETHSVGNATETAENEAETVRTRRNGSRTQDSPNGRDISTPKLPRRWKRVTQVKLTYTHRGTPQLRR